MYMYVHTHSTSIMIITVIQTCHQCPLGYGYMYMSTKAIATPCVEIPNNDQYLTPNIQITLSTGEFR